MKNLSLAVFFLFSGLLMRVSCLEKTTVSEEATSVEEVTASQETSDVEPLSEGRFGEERTLCVAHRTCNEKTEFDITIIYPEHTDFANPLAVAFVKQPSQTAGIFRETDIIPSCSSMSGLAVNERPKWITEFSNKPDLIKFNLKTHCFAKQQSLVKNITFSYTTLWKIETDNVDQNGNIIFEEKVLAHVLPNRPEFLILKGTPEIDRLCTSWNPSGCGSVGQTGLIRNLNLTSILNSLAG